MAITIIIIIISAWYYHYCSRIYLFSLYKKKHAHTSIQWIDIEIDWPLRRFRVYTYFQFLLLLLYAFPSWLIYNLCSMVACACDILILCLYVWMQLTHRQYIYTCIMHHIWYEYPFPNSLNCSSAEPIQINCHTINIWFEK